jgi:hypothetical protein
LLFLNAEPPVPNIQQRERERNDEKGN